jgi:hypothetical protein
MYSLEPLVLAPRRLHGPPSAVAHGEVGHPRPEVIFKISVRCAATLDICAIYLVLWGNNALPTMINIFRKIRKQLANENQVQKYFRYAFGEVALIMIGIFMALQLQNLNEKRKQDKEFKVILEQLYNAIIYDVDKFKNQADFMSHQIEDMDFILEHPDSISREGLPYVLFNLGFDNFKSYQSDAFFYVDDLHSDYENLEQNELVKQITGYLNKIKNLPANNYDIDQDRFSNFLLSEGLAYPEMDREDLNKGWLVTDKHYYPNAVLDTLQKNIKTNRYISVLKTYRSQKILYKRGAQVKYNDGNSILELIKRYYPEVRVIYENVGIIGTALQGYDDVGGRSTPMRRTDADKGIWETELYLKEGTVKFRCNDSWLRNWGGDYGEVQFPTGNATPDGDNIPVKAGKYHIKINLSDFTYEFTRIGDR